MSTAGLALGLLLVVGEGGDAYRRLVDEAVTAGRAGQLESARTLLDQAIALEPERPEALAERGGAFFVEGHYDLAARDLARALERKEDPWTRELLASSYLLLGRTDDALENWNLIGGPLLRRVQTKGGSDAVHALVRRELSCTEGETLSLDDVRSARLHLRQLGVVDRFTVRAVPVAEGRVDLEVEITERRGLGGSPVDFVLESVPPLALQTLRLEYANVRGLGLSVGGSWRFDPQRPEVRFGVDMARPFGLGLQLGVGGWWGRQTYDLDGVRWGVESRGAGLGLRKALGPRTVGRAALRWTERMGGGAQIDTGRLVVIEGGLDRRLVDFWRFDVDAGFRLARSAEAMGSVADYWRGIATLAMIVHLRPPEEVPIEPSDLALRLRAGWAGAHAPLDETFHPGAGEESDFPLRGRSRLVEDGLPLAQASRNLQVMNVEWRARLYHSPRLSVGGAVFVDVGRVRTLDNRLSLIVDVGVGLRFAARTGPMVRIDFGRGLSDTSRAWTFGLQQVF